MNNKHLAKCQLEPLYSSAWRKTYVNEHQSSQMWAHSPTWYHQQEAKALKELRQGKDRIIFTVDKGVTIVLLNKQDSFNKAQQHLFQRGTYRPLTADPPTNTQTNSTSCSRLSGLKKDWGTLHTKYPPKGNPPLGPQCLAGMQLTMGWPRSWLTFSAHW